MFSEKGSEGFPFTWFWFESRESGLSADGDLSGRVRKGGLRFVVVWHCLAVPLGVWIVAGDKNDGLETVAIIDRGQ